MRSVGLGLLSLFIVYYATGCSRHISFTVVDAQTGAPLQGADVNHVRQLREAPFLLWPSETAAVMDTTDEHGQVSFDKVTADDIWTVSKEGYVDAELAIHGRWMFIVPLPKGLTAQHVEDLIRANEYDLNTAERIDWAKEPVRISLHADGN